MEAGGMFAPLPSNPTPSLGSKTQWRPLVPVPANAPEPTFRHQDHGGPSTVWRYFGAGGELLGFVCRFDTPGGKEILPRTFCEDSNGNRAWRWKGWDVPRPLYGLERLKARPDAAVLVVEGEKTADAATLLFPDVVVVTSSGGSGTAGKTDWSALKGREVTIWPDADEPGNKYATAVVRVVRELGTTTVRMVEVPAGLPDGWDLADPLPDGWAANRLKELFANSRPVGVESGAGVKFPFLLNDQGVFFREDDGQLQKVCSPLKVLARTRNTDGEDWGHLLEVKDSDGALHEWAMPMAMLAGDGTAYRERLLSLGLHIEPGTKARNRLHSYVSTTRPAIRARCVSRVGWHEGVYVLPNAAYGGSDGERILLQITGSAEHALRCAGTLVEWQEHVAAPCAGNSRLVFPLSCAFAAPLLKVANEESGGFHLRGPSSVGKTTALKVAASVWGGGGVAGYLRNWRATSNGLEAIAEAHCDGLLCLDEMGQVHGREAGEVAYMLANGAGKSRAQRDGSARRASHWRVLFLSTGELSLADKMLEVGQRARAGQETRLVDVPADAGAGLGLFEDLHGAASAENFARHLCDASTRFYGVAVREYLEKVTTNPSQLMESLFRARKQWVAAYCPQDGDGQVQRVASRFGLVAAAGELAGALGILPYQENEAVDAATACFRAWLDARGGTGDAEIKAGLEQVERFFASHGESRFTPWEGNANNHDTVNRAGFRRADGDTGTEFFVLPSVWKSEICTGFDSALLARELATRGVLKTESDGGLTRSVRLPGLGNKRVYHVTAGVLGGGNDA